MVVWGWREDGVKEGVSDLKHTATFDVFMVTYGDHYDL